MAYRCRTLPTRWSSWSGAWRGAPVAPTRSSTSTWLAGREARAGKATRCCAPTCAPPLLPHLRPHLRPPPPPRPPTAPHPPRPPHPPGACRRAPSAYSVPRRVTRSAPCRPPGARAHPASYHPHPPELRWAGRVGGAGEGRPSSTRCGGTSTSSPCGRWRARARGQRQRTRAPQRLRRRGGPLCRFRRPGQQPLADEPCACRTPTAPRWGPRTCAMSTSRGSQRSVVLGSPPRPASVLRRSFESERLTRV